jgi:hypothetical protein
VSFFQADSCKIDFAASAPDKNKMTAPFAAERSENGFSKTDRNHFTTRRGEMTNANLTIYLKNRTSFVIYRAAFVRISNIHQYSCTPNFFGTSRRMGEYPTSP